jgi:hypothetical protein
VTAAAVGDWTAELVDRIRAVDPGASWHPPSLPGALGGHVELSPAAGGGCLPNPARAVAWLAAVAPEPKPGARPPLRLLPAPEPEPPPARRRRPRARRDGRPA